MHQAVLVIGPKNGDELEEALAPFYQMGCTMDQKEIKADPRSAFRTEYTKEEAEESYQKNIKRRPTQDQISFFRENFTEESDMEICKDFYKKKYKGGADYAPGGYSGDDFAYSNVRHEDGEYRTLFVSEENMEKALEWLEENDLDFYNTMEGYSKEEFLKESPDAHAYISSDYEYDEESDSYGYWDNPNGFWDWYQVGGRWFGYFLIKEGAKREECMFGQPSWQMRFEEGDEEELKKSADALKVGDIDFRGMEERTKEYYSDQWDQMWDLIKQSEGKTEEEIDKRFREFISAKEGETKEEFVERNKHFKTSAIVFSGEWFELENDGYYRSKGPNLNGTVGAVDLPVLLENMQEDIHVILVDCHR